MGSKLSVIADYAGFKERDLCEFENRYISGISGDSIISKSQPTYERIDIYSGKVDFAKCFSRHQFNVGAKWRRIGIDASASVFYHRGTNMIDWVMYSADDVFHSANFKLDNVGTELNASLLFSEWFGRRSFVDRLSVGYAYIHQKRHDDVVIYKSNYALEYLRHKVVATLDHRIWRNLSAAWAFRWQDRVGSYIKYASPSDVGTLVSYEPYALLDLRLQWRDPKYTVYVEGSNLTNRTYYDLGNIPQAGFWVKAGASFRLDF